MFCIVDLFEESKRKNFLIYTMTNASFKFLLSLLSPMDFTYIFHFYVVHVVMSLMIIIGTVQIVRFV